MERDIIKSMLVAIGENPERDGLRDTPERVCKSWGELFCGYKEDPSAHLDKMFTVDHDQLIAVTDINFFSTCEHHLLPFFGTVDIAYLPRAGGGVVGLSKLARVVDGFARRLQIQERLTDEIADAIDRKLSPVAVGVRVRAKHLCMIARGVRCEHARMTTNALRGRMLTDDALRAEWRGCLP